MKGTKGANKSVLATVSIRGAPCNYITALNRPFDVDCEVGIVGSMYNRHAVVMFVQGRPCCCDAVAVECRERTWIFWSCSEHVGK